MTLSINMNTGYAAQGGVGIGLMTAAGNPWSVPDALAQELVNRGLATAVNWPATGARPVYLGFKSAAEITALNAASPATVYPVGSTLSLSNPGGSDHGTSYRLVGTAFAAEGGGGSSGSTSVVSSSRALTAADNGNTLECSAGVALTVPAGLGTNFGVAVEVPTGTVSIVSSGGALLNGATTTLTRASANVMFAIVARASATDSYSVTGS